MLQSLSLNLEILDGRRQGTSLSLPVKNNHSPLVYRINEDESLRLRISLPSYWEEVKIAISDQVLDPTMWSTTEATTDYVWEPQQYKNRYASYFRNYFGIANFELSALNTKTGLEEVVVFSEIEILAKKLNAERASQMLDYLFEKAFPLHAASSATKQKGGAFDGCGETPSQRLDALEYVCNELEKNLPTIIRRPLTRLRQHKVIETVYGNTLEASEVSIHWLAQNTDQLIPEVDNENSHLNIEGISYRVRRLAVQKSIRSTDISENRRILGVLRILQQQIEDIILSIQNRIDTVEKKSDYKDTDHGYVSFFNCMSHHVRHLNQARLDRCERLKNRLYACCRMYEGSVPVKLPELDLTVSAKARSHHAYRDIMLSALKLYGTISWEKDDFFLSIHSIPTLYELFCLEQLKETILKINHIEEIADSKLVTGAGRGKHGSYNWGEWNASLLYQPMYKSPQDNDNDLVVNSEGWTKRANGYFSQRLKNRREPDFVIDIQHRLTSTRYLVVLDAKYTTSHLAYSRDLPSLVMKYIHGLHLPSGGYSPVVGLFILFPESGSCSFHHNNFGLQGNTVALPVLCTHTMSPNLKKGQLSLEQQLFRLFSEITKNEMKTYTLKKQIYEIEQMASS